jgi:hypothetical protein
MPTETVPSPAVSSSSSIPSNDITTLRVAQSELVSGNTSGKVYVRLSEGGVAFLTPRDEAESQIAAQLRCELLNEALNDGAKKHV